MLSRRKTGADRPRCSRLLRSPVSPSLAVKERKKERREKKMRNGGRGGKVALRVILSAAVVFGVWRSCVRLIQR